MKPLISLAALVVALGCSGAQAQYTDGTILLLSTYRPGLADRDAHRRQGHEG